MNNNYDTYLRATRALGLPFMSPAQFVRAETEVNYVFSSVIERDVFETSHES